MDNNQVNGPRLTRRGLIGGGIALGSYLALGAPGVGAAAPLGPAASRHHRRRLAVDVRLGHRRHVGRSRSRLRGQPARVAGGDRQHPHVRRRAVRGLRRHRHHPGPRRRVVRRGRVAAQPQPRRHLPGPGAHGQGRLRLAGRRGDRLGIGRDRPRQPRRVRRHPRRRPGHALLLQQGALRGGRARSRRAADHVGRVRGGV